MNKNEILHARLSADSKGKLEVLAHANKRSLTKMIEIIIDNAYADYLEPKKSPKSKY